jgi:hypothetical protein
MLRRQGRLFFFDLSVITSFWWGWCTNGRQRRKCYISIYKYSSHVFTKIMFLYLYVSICFHTQKFTHIRRYMISQKFACTYVDIQYVFTEDYSCWIV